MRRVLVGLVVALSITALACGDEDDDGSPASDASTGTGDSSTTNLCAPPATGSVGSCTEAQIADYSSCVEGACADKYESCYGPGYKSGTFGGPCASYITCTSKCACNDATCQKACTRSAECTTCVQGFATCSSSCVGKLSCALSSDAGVNPLADGGPINLGDGGVIRFDKTCADLLTCCGSLADATKKSQCMQVHTSTSMSAAGDAACSAAISQFCP